MNAHAIVVGRHATARPCQPTAAVRPMVMVVSHTCRAAARLELAQPCIPAAARRIRHCLGIIMCTWVEATVAAMGSDMRCMRTGARLTCETVLLLHIH